MDGLLLLQAFLIGLFCYLGSISSPWLMGVTGGYYVLGRPLVAGLIIGIILGDVTTGVILGVAVQAAFIATISTGGTQNSEITYAAYGGIALGILSDASPGVAVTLSVGIGALGLILHNFMMIINSIWNKRVEKATAKGDEKGIVLNNAIYPQIVNFLLRVVPITLAVYYGQGFVTKTLDVIPKDVIQIMTVLGGLLPALGVALLMNLLIKENAQFIYFLAGFVFIAFISNSMIALTAVALLIAYLVYSSSSGQKANAEDEVI